MIKVFVYGTLKRGGALDTGLSVASEDASVHGKIYSPQGNSFPCAKFGGDELIHGELHTYPSWALHILDQIESEGYVYERVKVLTEGGDEAIAYEFMLSVRGMRLVEGGVW